MAKITTKAGLVLGTNLKFHIADKSGTNIAIGVSGSVITLTAATSKWLATSETSGIVNRAIVVGDIITIGRTTNSANEGVTAKVTAVSATVITATVLTGTPVAESAGSQINVTCYDKYYQFLAASGLSFIDGVQGIVLKSKMDDLWDTSDLDKYPSAWSSIEPRAKSLANINGWKYYDSSTYNAIRDTALEIRATKTSAALEKHVCLRSTSNSASLTDQLTYWFGGDAELTAPNQFVMTGYANQLVKVYDYNNGTPIDKRGIWYTRLAMPGKTIIMESFDLQYAEIIPISAANQIDPKLTISDATIAAGGIYAGISYNLDVDGLFAGDVNGTSYTFAGKVIGNSQTNESIHAKLNWLWRQTTNINSDATGDVKRGDKQPPISSFSGDVFSLKSYLTGYSAIQRNNLRLIDTSVTERSWPLIYTRTISAPTLAIGGTMSLIHKNTHGTATPVYLQNELAVNQKDLPITASTDIVIAYSTYNTDGHVPNTPISLILAYQRPGYIESEFIEITQDASSAITAIPVTADTSYIGA